MSERNKARDEVKELLDRELLALVAANRANERIDLTEANRLNDLMAEAYKAPHIYYCLLCAVAIAGDTDRYIALPASYVIVHEKDSKEVKQGQASDHYICQNCNQRHGIEGKIGG